MPPYEVDQRKAAEAKLAERECEVLRLTASGLTSKDIVRLLGINDATVRGYTASARHKLAAESTPAARVISEVALVVREITGSQPESSCIADSCSNAWVWTQ